MLFNEFKCGRFLRCKAKAALLEGFDVDGGTTISATGYITLRDLLHSSLETWHYLAWSIYLVSWMG